MLTKELSAALLHFAREHEGFIKSEVNSELTNTFPSTVKYVANIALAAVRARTVLADGMGSTNTWLTEALVDVDARLPVPCPARLTVTYTCQAVRVLTTVTSRWSDTENWLHFKYYYKSQVWPVFFLIIAYWRGSNSFWRLSPPHSCTGN